MTKREPQPVNLKRLRPWAVVYVGTIAVVAVVAAIIWNRIVDLPTYMVSDDFRARMSESGLSQIVATDVYFGLVGIVAGLIVGVTAAILFQRLGWVVTLIAAIGAGLAGVITRTVGVFLGPKDFPVRIAAASRGEEVTIDFITHTWAPLAIWVAVAVIPVLIRSLIGRDDWIRYQSQAKPDAEDQSEVG